MSKTRPSVTIAAFTTAPLVAAIAMAILTPTGKDADVLVVAGLTPIFYIFAAASALIIGIPLYFTLSHYRLLNLCTILLSGVLIGGLCTFALRYPGPIQRNDFLLTVSIGLLSSFAFWAVVRYSPKKIAD